MGYQSKWKHLTISSFDYLMLINKYSSRSFNDTSQYPIFPWVGPCGCDKFSEIMNFETNIFSYPKEDAIKLKQHLLNLEEQELSNGLIRDLHKNCGVLNQEKAEKARDTYKAGPDEVEMNTYGSERFHLKFAFMNNQICLSYLVRIEPFTSAFIEYNGKLDHPDRMLSDVLGLWKKVLNTPQCNSELTPEWLYLPQIFLNKNFCYFGVDCNDKIVSNVCLPAWCYGNPFYFCMKLREFVEDYRFSKSLNYWIDMIFGKRQQTEENLNIFFSFATQEYYDYASPKEITREAVISTGEFFQLPKQLFSKYHREIDPTAQILQKSENSGVKLQEINDDEKSIEVSLFPKKQNRLTSEDKYTALIDIQFEKIRICSEDIFTILNGKYKDSKKYDFHELKYILTGFSKQADDNAITICKVKKVIPMLSVIRHKKQKSEDLMKDSLLFEIEFPNEYVLPMNYISYFTVQDKDYLVISRLFTSRFAVINMDSFNLAINYFNVDCLTSVITAIHCTKDSVNIIGGYKTGSIAIWKIVENSDDIKSSSMKKKTAIKDDSLPFRLEFRVLLSSSATDSSEIIAIDSNYDSEMFVAITKKLSVTIHSIGNGQCLNWIKLDQPNYIIQGVQLSKNGYFVLAYASLENHESKKTGKVERYYRSKICTFGINGEKISSASFTSNRSIKGIKLLERTLNPLKLEESVSNKYQSKKMLDFMTDDKILFFDTDKVHIMNCVDFSECKEIIKDIDGSRSFEGKTVEYKCMGLNSYKIFATIKENLDEDTPCVLKIFEPLSKKWINISNKILI